MGKLLRGKDFDIRDHGSHKIGATNVLRTLGRIPASIVFIFDLTKGILPPVLALVVPFFSGDGWGPPLAAFMALIGHCFPIFIGFKGGRGVSTGGGALVVLSLPTFFIAALTTGATVAIWRYVSLGSIVGSLSTMICGIIFGFIGWADLPTTLYLVIGPAIVILLHYDNIGRLRSGTEPKIGQKAKSKQASSPSTNASSNLPV
jgi:glycerol-3-phosphate acyltransferase PlsY